MRRRTLLRSLTGGVAALSGAGAAEAPCPSPARNILDVPKAECGSPKRGPRDGYFPDVPLRTHDGARVRFYTDLVMGKMVLFNFMYTTCDGRCPMYTANLLKVQKLLGGRVGRDIFMYSITLDPAVDTPGVLRDYVESRGVGPGWTFLTGKFEDVELLRRRLGFVDPDPEVDKDKSSHTGLIRFGNEKLDRWSACPALAVPEQIIEYISWMEEREGGAQ